MSTQQFHNEHLKITLTRESGCRVKLEATVSPQATQAAHQKAVKTVSKEISIPGFRKGKAPEAVIAKNFSTAIEREFKDILLNTSLTESFQLTKVFPFNQNSVKAANVKSASQTEGSVLTYEYEASPEIPTVTPEDLSIPNVPRKAVSQKDVELALEDLRTQRAEWVEITDRPAQEGDYVDIDIDALSEPARNICTSTRFAIEPDKMGEWMRRLIVGMTPGQVAEGMSEKDEMEEEDCKECASGEHTHEHNHSFVPTLCRITLHSVKEAKLPELDDELAKNFGVPTATELKEKVEISLNKKAEEQQRNTMRKMIEEALLSKYPFQVPASIIQAQLKDARKNIIDDLRSRGTAESSIQQDAKKIEEDIGRKIEHDLRLYFLTQKVAREHKLEVTKDEVFMEFMRQMWLQKMGENSMDTTRDSEEVQAQIHLQLEMIKALDFLIDKAQVS